MLRVCVCVVYGGAACRAGGVCNGQPMEIRSDWQTLTFTRTRTEDQSGLVHEQTRSARNCARRRGERKAITTRTRTRTKKWKKGWWIYWGERGKEDRSCGE